jgi:hypothetical protein
MRLQTESRRQSMAPSAHDISRAGISTLGNSGSSKRTSFVPLAGRAGGHRRISSVSDSGVVDFGAGSISQSLLLPEDSSSRRHSSIYGRISPSQLDAGQPDPTSVEVDGLRKEVQTLKEELEQTKHELLESNEAREASEMCVKALRDFIGENNIGPPETNESTLKLPTLPGMAKGHEEESKKGGSSVTGWGFKLWKDATLRTPSVLQTATIPPPVAEPLPQTPASATPLSRKLGGLFGTRSSASSVMWNPNHIDTASPQLQTNAASSVRDSMYSFSDASSVAEPISPPAEVSTHGHLMMRDVTDMGSKGASPSPSLDVKSVVGEEIGFKHSPVVVT